MSEIRDLPSKTIAGPFGILYSDKRFFLLESTPTELHRKLITDHHLDQVINGHTLEMMPNTGRILLINGIRTEKTLRLGQVLACIGNMWQVLTEEDFRSKFN